MLQQQLTLAMLAIALGVFASILLFVPFIIVSYRRRGTLPPGRLALWLSSLVYFWAIWIFTLFPLPDPNEITCAGINVDPTTFITDITAVLSQSAGLKSLLTHPVIMEMALNVLLFVPLGFFIRVLGGRGLLVALMAGLGVSIFVETTQLTGVWGLYPCAYRVFDVKDMMTNTIGAGVGSIAALLVPLRWRTTTGASAQTPRPVTKWRRLLAMTCDFLAYLLVGSAVTVGARLLLAYGFGNERLAFETDYTATLGVAAALALWVAMTLITGRTLGDYAVRLVYRGGPLPAPIARLTRLLGGIGLYGVLNLLPDPWNGFTGLFVIVALLFALFTTNGRGLPGILSGQRLVDDRSRAET